MPSAGIPVPLVAENVAVASISLPYYCVPLSLHLLIVRAFRPHQHRPLDRPSMRH